METNKNERNNMVNVFSWFFFALTKMKIKKILITVKIFIHVKQFLKEVLKIESV